MARLLSCCAVLALLAVACGSEAPPTSVTPSQPGHAPTRTEAVASPSPDTPPPTPTAGAEPAATPSPAPAPVTLRDLEDSECPYAQAADPSGRVDIVNLRNDFCRDWPDQDWSRHTVPFGQIKRGCPIRDCILALDAPGTVSTTGPYGVARFAPVEAVDYEDTLPIAVLRVGDVVRGYPLHILVVHEIVNDEVAGVPVVASFCPLCHTALAFDRRVQGEVLDFGISGALRRSDLVMYDRQTETWWQQATGEAIVGRHAGFELRPLPMSVLSFRDFRRSFPRADILSEETGFGTTYGRTPFVGYDSQAYPQYASRVLDDRLPPFERVVGFSPTGASIAVPFSTLREIALANVDIAGTRVVVLWAPGTASALDQLDIATSRDVGSAAAYLPEVDGRPLTLVPASSGRFRDEETGSIWDVTGLALSGPLAGSRLPPAAHSTQFWFAWASFNPGSLVWEPSLPNP